MYHYSLGESRMLLRDAKDLRAALDAYEESDVGMINTKEDSLGIKGKRVEETERLDHLYEGAFDRLRHWFSPGVKYDRVLDQLASKNVARAREDLEQSNSRAVKNLNTAWWIGNLKNELSEEKREIIQRRIEAIDGRMQQLQERLERMNNAHGLSKSLSRHFENQKKEWERDRGILEGIKAKIEQKQEKSGFEGKVKEVETMDSDIRSHIFSLVDLDHPDVVRHVLPFIDSALLANASGDNAPLEKILKKIEEMGTSGSLKLRSQNNGALLSLNRANDLTIIRGMARMMRSRWLYGAQQAAARSFYSRLAQKRIDAAKSATTGERINALVALPVGQRVEIAGSLFAVTAKRGTSVILREAGQSKSGKPGRTAVIDSEGELNTKNAKEFQVLFRDTSKPVGDAGRETIEKLKAKNLLASNVGLINTQNLHFDLA